MTALPTIKPDTDTWDWGEIVVFEAAIHSEGFEYAFDNYKPLFRRPELHAIEGDMGKLRDFMDAHRALLEAWEDEVGWEAYDKFYDDHLEQHRKEIARRQEAASTGSPS